MDLQHAQKDGPYTAYTLYFGILGHYFGHVVKCGDMVVKSMVPFQVLNVIRHRKYLGDPKGHPKLTTGREIASRRRLKTNQQVKKSKRFHVSTFRDFSTFCFSGRVSTFRVFFRFSGLFNFSTFRFLVTFRLFGVFSRFDCLFFFSLFDFFRDFSTFRDFSGLFDFFLVTFRLFGTF